MLIIAFAAFLMLVLSWLIAPNGEVAAAPVPTTAPPLRVGDPATA